MSNCCDRFVMIEGEEDSFETWQGLRGPYYTPSVSEDGTLSWTNNGGLQNPADRNIKGPPGPGGIPGGTTGQILAKASDEDFDTEWIDQPEMDAGHVSYDKTETYPDESVGDELNTINDTLDIQEVYDTASGDIASFNAPASAPLTSLVAQIEPVQDLHGYDAPWAGGAGVNIFNYNTFQNKLITSDGVINDSTTRLLSDIFTVQANNTYLVTYPSSGFIFAGHIEYNDSDVFQTRVLVDQTSGSTQITPTTNRIRLYFSKDPNSEPISKDDLATAMVTKGTTPPDKFYPYANECPITGWTGLSGKRTGKNLANFINGKGVDTSGNITDAAARIATVDPIKIDNTQSYCLSFVENTDFRALYCVYKNGAMIRRTTNVSSGTVLNVQGGDSVRICIYNNVDSSWATVENQKPMLEQSSTASTYEPYTSLPITVSWQDEAGTVYGGTVDVASGLLTAEKVIETKTWSSGTSGTNLGSVTRKAFALQNACVDNDSTDISNIAIRDGRYAWDSTHFYINGTNTRAYVYLPNDTSGDTEIQLCYSLAQPLTYQLTPQQVLTLVGQNNVFMDTGSVSVTYFAGTESALDRKVDKVEGKGLSTNDYTTAEKTKLSGIEAQANKTVIDATLSNQGQAADAKATGDAISLKAPVIVDTDSGAIVTYPDGMEAPMRSLVATIEPVQDLHGYDAPWAAGAGLNKLPKATLDESRLYGITVTIADDGGITLNGTPTSNATVTVPFDSPLPAGNYTWFTFNPSAIEGVSVSLRDGTSSRGLLSGTFRLLNEANVVQSFTAQEDAYYWRFQVNANTVLTNFTFKPMLCAGTVASATYAPYVNECPISGWIGLNGRRTGKNLFDTATAGDEWVTVGGYIITKDTAKSIRLDCKAGEVFTLSNKNVATSSNVLVIACFDANSTILSRNVVSSNVKNVTATVPSGAAFLIAGFNDWSLVEEAQLEVGSSATTYEAPVSNNIACTWFGVLGKNLLDSTQNESGGIDASGTEVLGSNLRRSSNYIPIKPNTSYALWANNNWTVRLYFYDASKTFISPRIEGGTGGKAIATSPSNAYFARWSVYNAGAVMTYDEIVNSQLQLEEGTSATAYEEYKNTVYGGRVDVVSGAMTVDRAIATYDGSSDESWTVISADNRAYISVPSIKTPPTNSDLAGVLSNEYKEKTYNNIALNKPGITARASITQINVFDTRITSDADWRTFLASNPLQVVYPLATPQAYQLTPQQVAQLFGNNSVFVDCGSVTVVSPRDTKLYIDKKLG